MSEIYVWDLSLNEETFKEMPPQVWPTSFQACLPRISNLELVRKIVFQDILNTFS